MYSTNSEREGRGQHALDTVQEKKSRPIEINEGITAVYDCRSMEQRNTACIPLRSMTLQRWYSRSWLALPEFYRSKDVLVDHGRRGGFSFLNFAPGPYRSLRMPERRRETSIERRYFPPILTDNLNGGITPDEELCATDY
jgi:hypothetical protein